MAEALSDAVATKLHQVGVSRCDKRHLRKRFVACTLPITNHKGVSCRSSIRKKPSSKSHSVLIRRAERLSKHFHILNVVVAETSSAKALSACGLMDLVVSINKESVHRKKRMNSLIFVIALIIIISF